MKSTVRRDLLDRIATTRSALDALERGINRDEYVGILDMCCAALDDLEAMRVVLDNDANYTEEE